MSRFDMSVIHTDPDGRPIPRPERADYATDLDYLDAFNAYHDRIAQLSADGTREGLRAGFGKQPSGPGLAKAGTLGGRAKRQATKRGEK